MPATAFLSPTARCPPGDRSRGGGSYAASPAGDAAGCYRTTAVARLSGRKPRNDGWRNVPSSVHSANDTSATSNGCTQCARRASAPFGGLWKGLVFAASADSERLSVASDASLNPVPPFPEYASLPSGSYTPSSSAP